jgi:lipoprotein-anchoring transpeptidase ErfK/SrfK
MIAAGLAAALLALAACGGGSDDTASGDPSAPAEEAEGDGGSGESSPFGVGEPGSDAAVEGGTLVATAVPAQIQVYATAAEDQPTTTLDNPNENGAPLVFLVDEDQGDWLKVLLPIRPNGSTGFVRKADVTVAENPYSIDIKLSEHRLIVTKGDEVIADEPIGVGTASTPTPGGRYYLKELLQPPDPNGAYGPYAYGLSGFSNVLEEFNGGDGVIGIHGTNEPELIGTDVSHGCIRMSNEAITELAGMLPLGTPVVIEA